MKKVVISVIVVIIVFISLFICVFKALKKDKKNSELKEIEVNEYYKSFNETASNFNNQEEKYKEIIENIYYSTVKDEKEKLLKTIKEYDETLKKLTQEKEKLEKRCNIYYENIETRKKCDSYKISYEQAKQVFKNDIKLYNKLVEEYNAWTKTKNINDSLEEYKTKNIE